VLKQADANPQNTSEKGLAEFVALLALLISLLALAIDAILPALAFMGDELAVQSPNDVQWFILALFIGLGFGQLVYGPLSDSVGRKPAIYAGLVLFILGTILCIVSWSFASMLAGRLLQGFGVAGPRIVSTALIRDKYEGRMMARIVSLTMTVFILVPAVAPALGQGVLYIAHWRWIFGLLLSLGLIALVWFAFRQEETLNPESRKPFALDHLSAAAREALKNRFASGYAIASGLIYAPFLGYLATAQQVLQEQYQTGELFPYYFGLIALSVGASSFSNAKLVLQFGMRRLSMFALLSLCVLAFGFLPIAWAYAGEPPLWMFLAWVITSFFSIGMLFANFNAMAMEHVGHIAGVAAAVIGTISTVLAVIFGGFIAQLYDGTILSVVAGFALMGTLSLATMYAVEKSPVRR